MKTASKQRVYPEHKITGCVHDDNPSGKNASDFETRIIHARLENLNSPHKGQ